MIGILLCRKQTIISEKKYEFLKELVKNVSDIQPQEEECEKTKSREPSSTGPRPRGRSVVPWDTVFFISKNSRIFFVGHFVKLNSASTPKVAIPVSELN